jgi:hypothetical protein
VVLLAQVVHKGGSSSQVHEEAHGADDGEAEALNEGVDCTITCHRNTPTGLCFHPVFIQLD